MKKWKGMKKAEFLIQLGRLLEQGYTLSIAIELLALGEKAQQRGRLQIVTERLRQGEKVHEAFEILELPSDIIGFIYFAETYGDMAKGLQEAGKLYLKREQLKQQLQKLFRYPLFLLWLLLVIAFVMVHYLFPHFKQMFSSLDLELPMTTIIFLFMIDILPYVLGLSLIIALVLATLYYKKFRHITPHKQIQFLFHIPYVKKFLQTLISYYFSVQLSGLLRGGMSVFQALTVFSKQNKVPLFHDEAEDVKARLRQGEEFASVIAERPIFIPELALVISQGQQTGSLERELYHYSELLFNKLEELIKRFLMIVQPALFMLIGSVVLTMFLAIMLPMFKLINSL